MASVVRSALDNVQDIAHVPQNVSTVQVTIIRIHEPNLRLHGNRTEILRNSRAVRTRPGEVYIKTKTTLRN